MFNFENFEIKLDTDVIGRNFIYCEEVESTNAELLNEENGIDIDGTVLLAEKQNNGKGRKDRKWYSAKDQNLTFSILLKRKISERKVNLVNFAAALAVSYTLENLFQIRVNLKWPNDVLIGHSKISGILIESTIRGSKINKLVIGIGFNVNQIAFQGSYIIPPTSIRKELNQEVDRERVLSDLLNNFEDLLNRVDENPEGVLNDWKDRCRMLGEKIMIQDENYSKSGIFEDVDEQGFLMLRTDRDTVEKIHFGDVSLR
ncbi:MAG: biotin--[acetyl-CoA-carboxylase] ligase [Ignavibacteria bacterium]|nr:biotin--[acetyl-CoA-carboxylase] ligase [Ignavibacteria bacterium]MCU7502464.1 biotin--[acetyl-CoA-carboxylase] ligase [Ignavibacteria bacterium]MCU7514971.1 biotin--[acetyl-CoA-carboxylase] ligase [Ignavibacteria bacterium]